MRPRCLIQGRCESRGTHAPRCRRRVLPPPPPTSPPPLPPPLPPPPPPPPTPPPPTVVLTPFAPVLGDERTVAEQPECLDQRRLVVGASEGAHVAQVALQVVGVVGRRERHLAREARTVRVAGRRVRLVGERHNADLSGWTRVTANTAGPSTPTLTDSIPDSAYPRLSPTLPDSLRLSPTLPDSPRLSPTLPGSSPCLWG